MENSSVKQYRTMLTRTVEPFFGVSAISDVTSVQIERWVQWMISHRGYKPTTIRFRFSILMSVFSWAMEHGLADTNPCKPVELPVSRSRTHRDQRAEVHIPSTETVLSVIAAAPERYRCMLWLMAGCGLRLGETMGLGRDRISFTERLITVDRQVACDRDTGSGRYGSMRLRHVKWREDGEQGRRVPLPDVVALALRRHLRDHSLGVRRNCCSATRRAQACSTRTTGTGGSGAPHSPQPASLTSSRTVSGTSTPHPC
ncbi:tyrosine-type recombinase/integrase [Streptomyces tuirus]|uniref:Tyrosine-type recombinase/integrase n=1 Tax=Streptomyces tuirus TaxID=68278 RepID=A0A941J460_9ACTN|nr:tyrosine-type recombinase/integrase [Streptomyces tuirus]